MAIRRTILAFLAFALLVHGQNASPKPSTKRAAGGWTQPKTPWGDPDFEGTWNNSTITELERPAEFAGKQTLTDAEAVALQAKVAEDRVDRAPRQGDPGTYNQAWFDRGNKVVPSRRTSLIIDPADGRVPALTAAGEQRQRERIRKLGPTTTNINSSGNGPFDTYEDISVVTRCITRGLPNAMIPGGYNNNYQIVQAPGVVMILPELMHEARVIRLNGSHLSPNIRQWMGDSVGHWEGNTLVVDVANFPDRDVTGFGVPYRWGETSRLHLIERFTRIDADTLDYEFSVDDPSTFTRRWTVSIPMVKTDGPLYEYACHEDNYSIVGILGGSRAQEKNGSR